MMANKIKPVLLSIAGSDSGGGAGIQADIKASEANGVFATTAITAITAQNTQRVIVAESVSPSLVQQQILAVLSDFKVSAIKTGMLPNKQCVRMVADELKLCKEIPLVVDPVIISTSGQELIDQEAVEAISRDLIPLADLVTPNLNEAEKLSGMKINSLDEMKLAAQEIKSLGCNAVLIKGGHLKWDEALDLFFDGSIFQQFRAKRIKTEDVHGTGCTLAAAIAAHLAKGFSLLDSISEAKAYLTATIRHRKHPGKGSPVCGHFMD